MTPHERDRLLALVLAAGLVLFAVAAAVVLAVVVSGLVDGMPWEPVR